VHHVQGREDTDPRLMKPDPFLLHEAIDALDGVPEAAVLIGDSTTDIEAARAAGIRVIGYLNKPIKHQTLSHADALITATHELTPRRRSWRIHRARGRPHRVITDCRINLLEIKAARCAGPARQACGTSGTDPPDARREQW
jgi:hypothetical protein